MAINIGPKKDNSEAYPDSWERFERAVDAAVKSGPKGRAVKAEKKAKPQKRASSSKRKP